MEKQGVAQSRDKTPDGGSDVLRRHIGPPKGGRSLRRSEAKAEVGGLQETPSDFA